MENETKILDVDDMKSSLQNFHLLDYFFFLLILLLSSGIGAYFGFFQKKKKDDGANCVTEDYLMGGRNMQLFPVSLSLIASFISGISILGHASEVYVYGIKYECKIPMIFIAGIFAWNFFLPVYCDLKLTSIYEYFEMRFDKRIRMLASLINIISTTLWLPLVIYVPGLVFNQVSGIYVHMVTPIVCMVCIFYTLVGGLKAVIWTDALQSGIMAGTVLLITVKGTLDVGGFGEVFRRNYESGRIEVPDLTIDPKVRVSILAVLLGGSIHAIDITCCGQMMMQRYLSVPNLKAARKVLVIFIIGSVLLISGNGFNGLLVYSYYHKCDPLTTKLAEKTDQLLPLFFMNILGKVPGLPGIFVAGVFSAALSSLSSGLNSLSAMILEDYVKKFVKRELSERSVAIIMRLTVLVFGIGVFGLVFVLQHLGMILQLDNTLTSVSSGPMFSLFVMGIFFPWVNGKSALTGGTVSLIVMLWICINRQLAVTRGEIMYPEKPVSVEGCEYSFANRTIGSVIRNENSEVNHISFLWYPVLGTMISILIANLTGLVFGTVKSEDVDVKLIAPFLRRFYKKEPKINELDEVNNLLKK